MLEILSGQQSLIPAGDSLCRCTVVSAITGRGLVKAVARTWFANGNILDYVQRNEAINKSVLVSYFGFSVAIAALSRAS
jgi:hypothetical protein